MILYIIEFISRKFYIYILIFLDIKLYVKRY